MERILLVLLLLCSVTRSEYSAKCNDNNSDSSLSLEPSNDGVEGRYIVNWCTQADNAVTVWDLVMRYFESRPPEQCQVYNTNFPLGPVHSRLNEPVQLNLNCTDVCFSTHLDLIFNGTCYLIQTLLRRGTRSSSTFDSLHYITNDYPKAHFTQNQPHAETVSYGDEVSIHWYLGFVPANEYEMHISSTDDKHQVSVNIEDNCTVSGPAQNEIVCGARLAPGNYSVQLRHLAPWTASSALFHTLFDTDFSHAAGTALPVAPSRVALWGAAGGAAAAGAVALLLLLGARARLAHRLRQRVLRDWRARREGESQCKPPAPAPSAAAGTVLLLYARDCELLRAVAAALQKALQATTGAKVLDLYASETVRVAARAPGEWLRECVCARDTRVLLLDTPAAALHRARARPPAPLEQPLLGGARAVVPRAAHAHDALLTLALRLCCERAHLAHAYRKYYVAQFEGLKVDALADVTPLRRYELPGAARALIRDLSAPPPPLAPNGQTNGVPAHVVTVTPNVDPTHGVTVTPNGAPAHAVTVSPNGAPPGDAPDLAMTPALTEALAELGEAIDALMQYFRDNPDYICDNFIFKE